MTDQLTPPKLTEDELSRVAKAKSEIMAGGAVTENLTEDELAGGWKGALSMLSIAALFAWLGFANFWIFVFVVGVVISIFLHELGHYLTARWTGMKVTQFFLFFGPRLWSFRRGETEYGIRAIPLGAFVRIIGMNRMDEVDPGDEARTYRQKSFPRRSPGDFSWLNHAHADRRRIAIRRVCGRRRRDIQRWCSRQPTFRRRTSC